MSGKFPGGKSLADLRLASALEVIRSGAVPDRFTCSMIGEAVYCRDQYVGPSSRWARPGGRLMRKLRIAGYVEPSPYEKGDIHVFWRLTDKGREFGWHGMNGSNSAGR